MTLSIGFAEGEANLDWLELSEALARGHQLPKAQINDSFLYRGEDTFLQRAAWIDGLGIAIKPSTIFPGNPAKGHPMIHGLMSLFGDENGALEALVDFFLVTKWKTAADSLLAARRLARPDSRNVLLLGTGAVAQSLYEAYSAAFPSANFKVWARSEESANRLTHTGKTLTYAPDLEAAVGWADIISAATPSKIPLIKGAWLRSGQHIDLVGAFRPDQREADDHLFSRGRLFIDSYDAIIDQIGEIMIPIGSGALRQEDIVADYYNLEAFKRASDSEITIFKNGGGAHLDLMTARYILEKFRSD